MALRQILVPIEDPSAIGEARRRAAALAAAGGLNPTDAGKLSLAITEAASNVLKHAERGRILLQMIEAGPVSGVEVLALDQGPGIRNLVESMRDGHSTAGSAGIGLGSLQRNAGHLDIYSRPGGGTIVRFEIWPGTPPQEARGAVGAVCLPKPGEMDCGDDWRILTRGDRIIVCVTDGLGHGSEAAIAARAAVAAVARHADQPPAQIIQRVHDALRPTRGAAAALAVIDPHAGLCTFCGVGNISASVRAGGKSRSMVSHNGILGHQVRKVQEFQYPYPPGALVLAHSDGLATHWDLASYPGLEQRHPSLIAATLYRDHSRGRDDVTVVALRA